MFSIWINGTLSSLGNWQQRVSIHQPPFSQTYTQPYSQTGQMIEMHCEYLSVWCIWLYVFTMSRTRFRVNRHSIVCLNVKKLLSQNRRHIWSLSKSNGIRIHKDLVCKWTLNNLVKLANLLICVVSTYLNRAFDCMILLFNVEFQSGSTLYILCKCQGTPTLKEVPYLKVKWQKRDPNGQLLSSWTNIQPFSQTGQMVGLCSENLSVRCTRLYVIIMSYTSFRVNPQSIVCLNVKELLARSRRHIWGLSCRYQIRTNSQLVLIGKLNH